MCGLILELFLISGFFFIWRIWYGWFLFVIDKWDWNFVVILDCLNLDGVYFRLWILSFGVNSWLLRLVCDFILVWLFLVCLMWILFVECLVVWVLWLCNFCLRLFLRIWWIFVLSLMCIFIWFWGLCLLLFVG